MYGEAKIQATIENIDTAALKYQALITTFMDTVRLDHPDTTVVEVRRIVVLAAWDDDYPYAVCRSYELQAHGHVLNPKGYPDLREFIGWLVDLDELEVVRYPEWDIDAAPNDYPLEDEELQRLFLSSTQGAPTYLIQAV